MFSFFPPPPFVQPCIAVHESASLREVPPLLAGANKGRNWVIGTYDKYQTNKKNFLVHQQGPTGAEIGSLGPMTMYDRVSFKEKWTYQTILMH